jgi:hypothetical protein
VIHRDVTGFPVSRFGSIPRKLFSSLSRVTQVELAATSTESGRYSFLYRQYL